MSRRQRILAELLGSLLLAAVVVGSGIMAQRLAEGNAAVALLGNTLATVAGLAVLIALFGPVSGAHFNPVISTIAWFRERSSPGLMGAYLLAQFAGCCAGAMLANVMFELPPVQAASQGRSGAAIWIGELVATAGLVLVAFTSPSIREASWRVPAWIAAAYWFTSSTSFANPAITVGRSLSDSFAGIRPADVPAFVGAQVLGALLGAALLRMFIQAPAARQSEPHPQGLDGPELHQ
jgi:glycerol uptake facilitator-like aquaporin